MLRQSEKAVLLLFWLQGKRNSHNVSNESEWSIKTRGDPEEGNVAGLELEFHDKDYKAEAKYDYYNAAGKLEKQVVRFPGKKFAQRRFGPAGGFGMCET